MPRYFLQRTVGDVTRERLDEIAEYSQKIRAEQFPQITWEHTHVVREDGLLKAFCVYESPDAESVKAHAGVLGLPVERFYEIETDLHP